MNHRTQPSWGQHIKKNRTRFIGFLNIAERRYISVGAYISLYLGTFWNCFSLAIESHSTLIFRYFTRSVTPSSNFMAWRTRKSTAKRTSQSAHDCRFVTWRILSNSFQIEQFYKHQHFHPSHEIQCTKGPTSHPFNDHDPNITASMLARVGRLLWNGIR